VLQVIAILRLPGFDPASAMFHEDIVVAFFISVFLGLIAHIQSQQWFTA
jgi:hypothetical protein